MGLLTLTILAIGLAMDAFAVSISNGMSYSNIDKKKAIQTALTFGGFQAGMPIIGYLGGRLFSEQVQFIDHWVALLLLGFLGGKMVVEGIKGLKETEEEVEQQILTGKMLCVQGIATSIDALAVGISFALMGTNILIAATLIGIITFACCIAGAYLGKKAGGVLQQRAELFGGAILICIGLKIFIEHIS